jgi:hypothetical protein
MFKHKLGILIVCLAASPLVRAQSSSPALPAAPIRDKVQTACTECHSADIVVQQRLDRKIWIKEVDKMIKWGALVEPSDRDAFIDYLSTNFGPNNPFVPRQNPPAEQAPRKASSKKSGR